MTEADATSEDEREERESAPPADSPAPEPSPTTHADAFAKVRATWGFPAFARDFPNDAELATLVEAFAAGDYATVREGAPALAAKTGDADVKRAAELLRARIEPDPTSRLFFALTAALLVFLMAWWATHDGKHRESNPSTPSAKPPATVEIVK
jgi:hypothetical protein